jgi:cytochrome oxidase Cu insertion factor (SCO1/SenC/PrrC family)
VAARRLRRLVWIAVLALGICAGALIGLQRLSHRQAAAGASPVSASPQVTWAAGAKRAPDFSLVDQAGKPVSIARFRGRPVIVTFMDPVCTDICPTEAKVLAVVDRQVSASERPVVIAVSVNQWANARRNLLQDMKKWNVRGDWHWAVGGGSALAQVWRAYQVAVLDVPRTAHGVTTHEISHTALAFVVDRRGYQRAVFTFPFPASDVVRTLGQLAAAAG